MSNTNDLKKMKAVDIKILIRKLERQTKTEPLEESKLDLMTFFDAEDYVAELEKERSFEQMSNSK